ncbi:hypothetical protein MRX96_049013 [Rhipicephalus microplus]
MLSAKNAAFPGGRSGARSGSRHRGASRECSGSRSGHVSSGPTRSRSCMPTSSNCKYSTPSWADKARGRRESPRGDDSDRVSFHASEFDEMRRANKPLRKENAQLKQEMSTLAAEMAEIRKLASSPPFGAARPNPGHHGYVLGTSQA